jgi:hypothetical protein
VVAYQYIVKELSHGPYQLFYYPAMMLYGFCQGIVWTGLWVIAHECGHSAFSKYSVLNDTIGFVLHSALIAPYFSWKSTHRRHHIYAGHMEKDLNYVPLLRDEYAAKIGLKAGQLDELGEDAPLILTLRIILQQTIGWNWYIMSNITCPESAVVKPGLSSWRYSHFDPWGGLFRSSEAVAILLSDVGCLLTLGALYEIYRYTGSFGQVFWLYIIPWMWVNHWIGMLNLLNIHRSFTSNSVICSHDNLSSSYTSRGAQVQCRCMEFHPRRHCYHRS